MNNEAFINNWMSFVNKKYVSKERDLSVQIDGMKSELRGKIQAGVKCMYRGVQQCACVCVWCTYVHAHVLCKCVCIFVVCTRGG